MKFTRKVKLPEAYAYYHSPGYLQEKFIQFEDDAEAMMFALRWAK